MEKISFLFTFILFLSSCAYVTPCFKISESEGIVKATQETKQKLNGDLMAGKLAIGAELMRVRAAYGQPDDMFVSGCTARLIYRLDSGKNVTLWFDDGKHLSMWTS